MKKIFTDIKELKKGDKPISNVGGIKQIKFAGFKVSPTKPTPEQVEKINRFTRREFTAEELYVGQMRLDNNAIDRDRERFSEEVIQRFVATTLRKTMLLDHDRNIRDSAAGKFFDVELEKMPLQQAIAETGENFKLPDGITEVWFHSPWFYIPINGIDPKEIVKIDAAIYDWSSIGFRAGSLVPVMDKEGKILFWEYRGSGDDTEMTEGSLVYLGAQYGMSVKSYESDTFHESNQSHESNGSPQGDAANPPDGKGKSHIGGSTMEFTKLLAMLMRLFPGKTFTTEDAVESEMRAAIEAGNRKAAENATAPLNAKIAELEPFKAKVAELEPIAGKVKGLTDKVAELTPLATDGKAYRDGLVTEYVSSKAKLEEISTKPEDQAPVKKMAEGFPIDFLKSEVKHLKKRVAEKFPAGSELGGTDDPEKRGKKPGEKQENPLKPKAKK